MGVDEDVYAHVMSMVVIDWICVAVRVRAWELGICVWLTCIVEGMVVVYHIYRHAPLCAYVQYLW